MGADINSVHNNSIVLSNHSVRSRRNVRNARSKRSSQSTRSFAKIAGRAASSLDKVLEEAGSDRGAGTVQVEMHPSAHVPAASRSVALGAEHS